MHRYVLSYIITIIIDLDVGVVYVNHKLYNSFYVAYFGIIIVLEFLRRGGRESKFGNVMAHA